MNGIMTKRFSDFFKGTNTSKLSLEMMYKIEQLYLYPSIHDLYKTSEKNKKGDERLLTACGSSCQYADDLWGHKNGSS